MRALLSDSTAPTWKNLIDGQSNLMDAVDRTIAIKAEGGGKEYKLIDERKLATLMVRYERARFLQLPMFLVAHSPRGWHLDEAHVSVDGCAFQILSAVVLMLL